MRYTYEQLAAVISSECVRAERTRGLAPCVKVSMQAMLCTADGAVYYGTNGISNCTLTECPRVTYKATDYTHCVDTCKQPHHAEPSSIAAAHAAGSSTAGATLYLTGHTVCCANCQAAMAKAGLKEAFVVNSEGVVNHYVF